MSRDEFMNGQSYKMPPKGTTVCTECSWRLAHCERDDWDGYECKICHAKFTERCSFEEDCR